MGALAIPLEEVSIGVRVSSGHEAALLEGSALADYWGRLGVGRSSRHGVPGHGEGGQTRSTECDDQGLEVAERGHGDTRHSRHGCSEVLEVKLLHLEHDAAYHVHAHGRVLGILAEDTKEHRCYLYNGGSDAS